MLTIERPTSLREAPAGGAPAALETFLRAQAVNVTNHAAAIRPFRNDEFGSRPAAPSDAHIRAANELIQRLRQPVQEMAKSISQGARSTANSPSARGLQEVLRQKDRAGERVKSVERVWDFYFELFGQRQAKYAPWLLAADRIALDCYQAVYSGLGMARSVPSPPPFACMETGFTPATYRRGVSLTRLERQANPFPIVQIPYHRLVNPWTLGAVHHEVSHNLQSDLGLWEQVPARINKRLLESGIEPGVAATWAAWNKEIWADLAALLLGGPAIVASLIDVVASSPARAASFNPAGVHPPPYLRTLINLELLRRMGFTQEAAAFGELWNTLYPGSAKAGIPASILASFNEASRIVVDEICYAPYPRLGNKSLAGIVSFNRTHDGMTREAAQRIARGTDPGVVPARFLVGAARWALDRRMATPAAIAHAFYQALVWR